MDSEAALTLAVQLVALCTVVSGLILYLLCKVRSRNSTSTSDETICPNIGRGRAVLVTSADNLLGLHLSYHLAVRGFRVFAGLKPANPDADNPTIGDSTARRILEGKWKQLEARTLPDGVGVGSLVTLPLDVTREDILHNAVGTIRRHLPAGEDGLWAVLNTGGVTCKSAWEGQDAAHWDVVIKQNVTGTLKVSKTFMPLLRCKKGRLINVGAQVNQQESGSHLTVHTAGRYAVEGASAALRHELRPMGIKVISLHPEGLPIGTLFAAPCLPKVSSGDAYVECEVRVLPDRSLQIVEEALLSDQPQDIYQLNKSPGLLAITDRFLFHMPVQVV